MMQPVIIVSGLPRSGTSMMMKMLAAGGIEIHTDHLRKADEDNPQGYYEVELVKHLQHDSAWLHQMKGKAVKIISFLLYYLPLTLRYQVIFMQREMQEIVISQKKMLARSGQPSDGENDDLIAQKFEQHLRKMTAWLPAQRNIDYLYVDYNKVLTDPRPHVHEVRHFLQRELNAEAMVSAVDASLYRNRAK